MQSLFAEELDGPTFANESDYLEWWTFESPYALAYEAQEHASLARADS